MVSHTCSFLSLTHSSEEAVTRCSSGKKACLPNCIFEYSPQKTAHSTSRSQLAPTLAVSFLGCKLYLFQRFRIPLTFQFKNKRFRSILAFSNMTGPLNTPRTQQGILSLYRRLLRAAKVFPSIKKQAIAKEIRVGFFFFSFCQTQ